MNTFRETPERPIWSPPPRPSPSRWPTTMHADNCRRVNPERLTFSVVFEFETRGCKKMAASPSQRLAAISLQPLVSNCWWTTGYKKIPCDHYHALDLTVQPPSPDTGPQGPPPRRAIWWSSLETSSNLVTLGPPPPCWYPEMKHIRLVQAGGTHPTVMLSCLVCAFQMHSFIRNLHIKVDVS